MENITINMENLNEKERKSLISLIEKANNPNKQEQEKPYYFISETGSIFVQIYNNDNYDKLRYMIGNYFRTKEGAEEKLKELKIKTQWKRLSVEAGEEKNAWNDSNKHWFAYYNYGLKAVVIEFHQYTKHSDIYFPTKELLKSALNEIGEENIKKYILGVKE